MEQLIFGMMQVEQKREETMEVNVAQESVEVLVTLMARAMVVVIRSSKEETDEGPAESEK